MDPFDASLSMGSWGVVAGGRVCSNQIRAEHAPLCLSTRILITSRADLA